MKTFENFADGVVKGKSRPGRVKRSGASCSGSVSDLRKRAKNSSGEKAKMYHWCANMKSGKKKTNEEVPATSTGSVAMPPTARFKPVNVTDRRRKKGQEVLLKRFRQHMMS